MRGGAATDRGLRSLLGSLRDTIEDLAGWARIERPDLSSLADNDGFVTIMFSDIEGSTALNQTMGDDRWMELLGRHDAIFREQCHRHHGQIVKAQGDGFMVAFPTARDAVGCAIALERQVASLKEGLQVRIGLHRGSVVHRAGDLFGLNVAIAARVASTAHGGEILITDSIRTELPDPMLSRLGKGATVKLRGLEGRHRVAVVHWRPDPVATDSPTRAFTRKRRHEQYA